MSASPYSAAAGGKQHQDDYPLLNGHAFLQASNHLNARSHGQYSSSLTLPGGSRVSGGSGYPGYLSPLEPGLNNPESQMGNLYAQSAALSGADNNYLDAQGMFDIARTTDGHHLVLGEDSLLGHQETQHGNGGGTFRSIGAMPSLHHLPDPPESATTRLRMQLTQSRSVAPILSSRHHATNSARPNDSAAMFLSPMVPAVIRTHMDDFDKTLASQTASRTPISTPYRSLQQQQQQQQQNDRLVNDTVRGPHDAEGIPLLPSHHAPQSLVVASPHDNEQIQRDLFASAIVTQSNNPHVSTAPQACASPVPFTGSLVPAVHQSPHVLSPVPEQRNIPASLPTNKTSTAPTTTTSAASAAIDTATDVTAATNNQPHAMDSTRDISATGGVDRSNGLGDTFPYPVPENLSVAAISEARKERESIILAVYTNVETWETNVKSELRERRNVYDKTKAVLDVQLKAYAALYNSFFQDEMRLSEILQMTVARHFAQCQVEDDALRHYKLTPTSYQNSTSGSYEPSFLPALRERLFNSTNPMGGVSNGTVATGKQELVQSDKRVSDMSTNGTNLVTNSSTLTSLVGNGSSSGFLSEPLNGTCSNVTNVAETPHGKAMQDILNTADPATNGRQLRSRSTAIPVVSLEDNLDTNGMLRAADPHERRNNTTTTNAQQAKNTKVTHGTHTSHPAHQTAHDLGAYYPIRNPVHRLASVARAALEPYQTSLQTQPVRQPGRRGRPPLAEKRNASNAHNMNITHNIHATNPQQATYKREIRKHKDVQQLRKSEIDALKLKFPLQLPSKAFGNNDDILYTFEIGWEDHIKTNKSANAALPPALYIRLLNIKSSECASEKIEEAGKKWFKSPQDVFEHAVGVFRNTSAPVIIESAADKIYTRIDGVPYTIKALRSLKGGEIPFVFQNPQENGTDHDEYFVQHIKPNVREATILSMI